MNVKKNNVHGLHVGCFAKAVYLQMLLPQSLPQLWLLLFACFVVFLQKLQVNTDFFSLSLRSKSTM